MNITKSIDAQPGKKTIIILTGRDRRGVTGDPDTRNKLAAYLKGDGFEVMGAQAFLKELPVNPTLEGFGPKICVNVEQRYSNDVCRRLTGEVSQGGRQVKLEVEAHLYWCGHPLECDAWRMKDAHLENDCPVEDFSVFLGVASGMSEIADQILAEAELSNG